MHLKHEGEKGMIVFNISSYLILGGSLEPCDYFFCGIAEM